METGITYGPPMLVARRAGRKTQTRRLGGLEEINKDPDNWQFLRMNGAEAVFNYLPRGTGFNKAAIKCPYGQAGDTLYIKEPFRTLATYDDLTPTALPADAPIHWTVDGPAPAGYGKYRHGRFMPRRLARDRDELVAVRCERLRSISEADAKAEGYSGFMDFYNLLDAADKESCDLLNEDVDEYALRKGINYPLEWYRMLWVSISGPESWQENPWVWVYEFRPLASAADPFEGLRLTPELEALLAEQPTHRASIAAAYQLGLGELRQVLTTVDNPRRLPLPEGRYPARCINDLRGPLVRFLNVVVAAQHLKHWWPFGIQPAYFSKDELRGLRFLEVHLDTFLRNATTALTERKLFTSEADTTGRAGVTNYVEGLADLLSEMLTDLNTLPDPREGSTALRMYAELNLVTAQPAEEWDDAARLTAAALAVEEALADG